MEAWLAELEKEIDYSASTLSINNPYYHDHQNETMEASFNEQIGATLGENFPNPWPLSSGSNNNSPHWDFDCNNVIKHFTSSPHIFIEKDIIQDVIVDNENYIINDNNNFHDNDNNNDNNNYYYYDNDDNNSYENNNNNNNHNNNNNNNNNNNIDSSNNNVNVKKRKQSKAKVDAKKNQGGTKRKRQPSQVQDHIIAERKRRELLRHMFISLSAIVPGLKKVDKTSVLGETIKYMKQLQEKVKALEEVATNRRVMVVKNSPLIMDTDDTDSSSTVDDNCPSGNCEIEVKISGNTLLLKVCCEDQKGILAKLFAELDKHDLLSVSNCSVIQLGSLGLDITIAAQIKERCFIENIRGFIKSLRSGLGFSS